MMWLLRVRASRMTQQRSVVLAQECALMWQQELVAQPWEVRRWARGIAACWSRLSAGQAGGGLR